MFSIADKPLKKRKQDTYPQEPGGDSGDGPTVQGGNTDSKLRSKKTNAASNGASRPALMVSIDLQQAGRIKGQPVVVLEAQTFCEDHLRHLKTKPDGKVDKVAANRPGIIKQNADNPRKSCSDRQPEALKQKPESQRESKHKHEGKTGSGKKHSEDRRLDTPRPKHDKHSEQRSKEEKNHNIHRPHISNPETPKTASKAERNSKHGDGKARDRERDKNKEKERDRDKDKVVDRDDRDKDREKEKDRVKDKDRDYDKDKDKIGDKNREKVRDREGDKEKQEKNKTRDRDKDRKHKTSRENCSRPSPDRPTKPDSPRVKQDDGGKSTDLNGRQKTESSGLQNAQNKKDRKSGDGSASCQAGNNKQQPLETKHCEFPSYLLGGKSGSLKNFVIPKLKRDVKDLQLPDKLIESWTEPLVRLERLSLIKDLNKGTKPVVVLNKLNLDEVKRIIKESRNTNSTRFLDKSGRGMTLVTRYACKTPVH